MEQQLDTNAVTAAVTALTATETQINRQLNALRQGARNLQKDWNSQAGYAALSRFYDILSGNDARSQVLRNYIALLSGQVSPGYQSAVQANTRLSDLYK